MTPRSLKAVLFDFDGVLGQTMEDNFRAWQAAFRETGVEIGREEYFVLEGLKLIDLARTLSSAHGRETGDWEALVRRKEEHYAANHHFSLFPGVEEALASLEEKRVPKAVVSAARRPRLELSVPAGFLAQFHAVVTGEKTERGKPFPDPYLAAAKEIGVPIGKCLVVENAPLGIRSAKAAGAFCVAICSTLSKDKLIEADATIDAFSDLITLPMFQALSA